MNQMSTAPSSAFRLEAQMAVAEPRSVLFQPGMKVEAITVGKRGDWKVDAPGVLDVHGQLKYDNGVLYVRAESQSNMFVDDEPVGAEWKELHPPCTIKLGPAQLLLREATQEDTQSGTNWLAANLRAGASEGQLVSMADDADKDAEATKIAPLSVKLTAEANLRFRTTTNSERPSEDDETKFYKAGEIPADALPKEEPAATAPAPQPAPLATSTSNNLVWIVVLVAVATAFYFLFRAMNL